MKTIWFIALIPIFLVVFDVKAQEQRLSKDSVIYYEYIPEVDHDLIADRLSCLEKTIPLNYHTRVIDFIDYFATRDREYTKEVFARSPYYFHIFEEYLEKYNLPDELKYLSIVESGLNPRAISRAGAGGLWQFMPSTGGYYGLHKDWYLDDRMDPHKSTEAACKYLGQLYAMFDDWELALAAYNAGPGNVRKAIRRSGYKKKFWEIYRYLPAETRSYVPQFVAMTYLMNYGEWHNLEVPKRIYEVEADTILISSYFHLPTLANLLGICPEDLQRLNPSIKRDALPQEIKSYPIKLPKEAKYVYLENRQFIFDSASVAFKDKIEYQSRNSVGSTYGRKQLVHRVKSGEVLGLIAQRYGVRINDIRKWNGFHGNLIRTGQRLNIWVHPADYQRHQSGYVSTAKSKEPQLQIINGNKTHLVAPGDTLWDISRKYEGLSIEKLKKLNNLTNNNIKPGQKLIVG